MFVKIRTWFPFDIQIYINGREQIKHVFDSTKLCRRLDAFAESIPPFLDNIQKKYRHAFYSFSCTDVKGTVGSLPSWDGNRIRGMKDIIR